MFTWEEAGLLRQMLQVVFWALVLLGLAVATYFLWPAVRQMVK
jgi:hypothetical protein